MYKLKAYCAGVLMFKEDITEQMLKERLGEIKKQLLGSELTFSFGLSTQIATEVCIDIYEQLTDKWRQDLSVAYKQ